MRAGVLAFATTLLAAVVALAGRHALGAGSADPANDAPPATEAQTRREVEPPRAVGPEYDDDRALPRTSRRVASYTLSATLAEATHVVRGSGVIRWENDTPVPAGELYVHLYLNAFKNSRTLFLRSPFGAGRSGAGAKHFGYVDVKRFAVREMGDTDVWPHGATSEDDPADETDIRVPLPRPVGRGEQVTIDVEWESQLPEIVERTGYVRDFVMVAQWFPKLAARSAEGRWVHFPFNPQSEFFADFGSYDVTLDVPKASVVGATGVRVSEETRGERKILHYHQDDVHDFAWTAWPAFRELTDTVDGVAVRILYPPGNERNADATLRAVRFGLPFFGARFGRYPYPTLTVVHPPEWAPGASGMEYPTLITTGGPWQTSLLSSFVERVTLHELGHQWFYGLVASDEHASPFLDEGLTTYAESTAMKALLGVGDGFQLGSLTVSGDAYFRAVAASAARDNVVALPAADFVSFREIGSLVYARTGTILETLARTYGEPLLRQALGRYARRYRFEHPGPKHFVAIVREVMGDEAADVLSAALFEAGTVDFVATDLDSVRVRSEAGIFDEASGRRTVEASSTPVEPPRYQGRVVVRRRGALTLPVDVDLVLEDGTRLRRRWDGRGRHHVFEYEGTSPLEGAIVDPDDRVLLDDDLTNNAVRRGPGSTARLAERALYYAELLLGAVGP